jgi:hypothetical protein
MLRPSHFGKMRTGLAVPVFSFFRRGTGGDRESSPIWQPVANLQDSTVREAAAGFDFAGLAFLCKKGKIPKIRYNPYLKRVSLFFHRWDFPRILACSL